MSNSFLWLQEKKAGQPTIIFAGHNIGEDYLYELTSFLKDKKFGVINISKSGTTTETALAFRLLKKQCEEQRGKEMARKVIVAVTDAKKGAARVTADKEGYKSFIIPDNVGGRFSVLTPVGLLLLPLQVLTSTSWLPVHAKWKKYVLTRTWKKILQPCMLLHAMSFIRMERKSKFWSTSSLSFITSWNGGNSFMENLKVKTTKVSTQVQ